MHEEQRGLRLPFSAKAEVFVENSATGIPSRVTELSLRGCRLEMSGSFAEHQRVIVKVFHSGEYVEAPSTVIYANASGVGLLFGDVKPLFREVLQKWVLSELDKQTEAERPKS
ncbi:MAG: PilZ domain-containing protein [Candidatus Acidiferrum sp.]